MSDAVVLTASATFARTSAGSSVLTASVVAVAVASPFERVLPGAAVAGMNVTTVEAMVLIALMAFAACVWADPSALKWRSPITMPGALLFLVVLATAVLAPEFRGNAVRFAGRLTAAMLVMLLAQSAIVTESLARALIVTLLIVGSIVGFIAVLELAQVPAVIDGLRAFRPGFHVVGGQVRATSTMFYPTITSMYLELVFALGLATLTPMESGGFSPRWRRLKPSPSMLPFLALALVGAGVIATFTRAGLISMALSLAVMAFSYYSIRRRWEPEHKPLAALAIALVAFALFSQSPALLMMRFGTDTSQDWYGASYEAPAQLRFRPGGVYQVPVTVTNEGMLTWQSQEEPQFALSYHWLDAGTEDVVQFDGARTEFAQPVRVGEQATVQATVRAPGYPGSYLLVWDVVHEHRAWLSTEGIPPARSDVTIEGAAITGPMKSMGRLPVASIRMPRRTLWRAALRIAADHPFAGVGPDNFRHVYGRYLRLATWDTRVHSNNMYLEALADMGVPGLAALLGLIAAVAFELRDRWRAISPAQAPMLAAVTAAWLSIAGHGLVDSFITFTPTYLLFALTAGLTFSMGVAASPRPVLKPSSPQARKPSNELPHAHRI
jgi:O-Antigen ligase